MTDIPVGSPPVPAGRHAAPGGWYPDPLDRGKERYWDGWQWSRTTRELEGPVAGPTAGGQPYGGPGYGSQQPGSQPYGGGYPPQPPDQSQQGAPGGYGQNPYQPQQQDPNQQPYGQNPNQQPYQQNPNQQPYGQNPYQQPGPYPSQPGAYGYGTSPTGPQRMTADGMPLAGWWWRVLAVLMDGLIVSLVVALLSFRIYSRAIARLTELFEASMRAAQSGQAAPMPSATSIMPASDQLLITLATVVVGLTYQIAFLRWKGATPGKLISRLRVVPVDQGRSPGPLPWSSVLIRAAIWVLPGAYGLFFLVRVLDSLFPLWQPKRQALHDLAAHTQVIKLPSPTG